MHTLVILRPGSAPLAHYTNESRPQLFDGSRPGPSGLLPPPRVGEAPNAYLTSSPGPPRRTQRLDDMSAGGADLRRNASFASAMEPAGRYYQNPFYDFPTYALPFQDNSPLHRGLTSASGRYRSIARRSAAGLRGTPAYVTHNPFKASNGKRVDHVPENLTFDDIAATAEPLQSMYQAGEGYRHPTASIQRPYQHQVPPPQVYTGHQQPQQQHSAPNPVYQQPLLAQPSVPQEQIQSQPRPFSPPQDRRPAATYRHSYSGQTVGTNQEPGGLAPWREESSVDPSQTSTYPPLSQAQGPQRVRYANTRPTSLQRPQDQLSPVSATRTDRPTSLSFRPPATDGRPASPEAAAALPPQIDTTQEQIGLHLLDLSGDERAPSHYVSPNLFEEPSELDPPPPMSYLVNRPTTSSHDVQPTSLPPSNTQRLDAPFLYDTGTGFGTAPDLDDDSGDGGEGDSADANKSLGDMLLSFIAFVVVVLFLPVIVPYRLIRSCFGSRSSYQLIPDSSKPGRLDASLRHLSHIPKMAYQHFLLLRLPTLYFSRVARIFEEADLSLRDLKTMALESAEKNLSNKGGARSSPVWHWERGGARGGCLPPAYESLRMTWDEFVGNLLREWKTFNLISVLLLRYVCCFRFAVGGATGTETVFDQCYLDHSTNRRGQR